MRRPLSLLLVLTLVMGCTAGAGAPSKDIAEVPTQPAVEVTPAPAADAPTAPATPTVPTPPVPAPRPSRTPPPPPPPPAACAPLVVLGARGSGQPPGLGAEVAEVVDALQTLAVDTPLTAEAVDYVATPIADALLAPERFATGVLTGAQALRTQTIELQQRCPDAHIIWAGYSQGALVVRAAIDVTPDPATARVAAVVLLADPSRAAGDPVNRGTAPTDVGGPATTAAASAAQPVPAAWSSLTTSWCLAGDPFCDGATSDTFDGVLIHTQGYREQDVTGMAATEAAILLGLA